MKYISTKTIIILVGISMFFIYGKDVYADNIINFSDYQKQVKTIENKNISKTKTLQKIKDSENIACTYIPEDKDRYVISPICLLKNELPAIEFKEAIDYLWQYIDGFNTVYNDTSINFSYEGTSPIFRQNYEILPKKIEEKLMLVYMQEQGTKIRIHKSNIAYQTIKKANFYAVYKDTSILKRCTKQNYTVALQQIDGKILGANQVLNLNKEIMNLKGYCKGSGPQDLLFYGGVCGFATQLFRTSLLVPSIEITKRYGHNERLVPYYSDYIFGDDAALYENNKQLEIQNKGDTDIYFKKLDKGKGNYFVMILPEKGNQGVTIKKQETKNLHAEMQREIYQKRPDMIIKTDSFVSKYIKKTYTTR